MKLYLYHLPYNSYLPFHSTNSPTYPPTTPTTFTYHSTPLNLLPPVPIPYKLPLPIFLPLPLPLTLSFSVPLPLTLARPYPSNLTLPAYPITFTLPFPPLPSTFLRYLLLTPPPPTYSHLHYHSHLPTLPLAFPPIYHTPPSYPPPFRQSPLPSPH